MDGELLLVILSSVAQQEVENISANAYGCTILGNSKLAKSLS